MYHSNKIKIAEYYETWDVNKSSWLKSARDSFELNIDNDIKAIDHQYNYSYFYNTYASHTREEFICTYIINSTNTEPISIYKDLKIYPNPIHSKHFEIYTDKSSQYSIIDMQGKRVQNGILNVGINQIELPLKIDNGIYLIQIGNTTQKLIIHQ